MNMLSAPFGSQSAFPGPGGFAEVVYRGKWRRGGVEGATIRERRGRPGGGGSGFWEANRRPGDGGSRIREAQGRPGDGGAGICGPERGLGDGGSRFWLARGGGGDGGVAWREAFYRGGAREG